MATWLASSARDVSYLAHSSNIGPTRHHLLRDLANTLRDVLTADDVVAHHLILLGLTHC